MNDGVTGIVFSLLYVSLKEFGDVGLSSILEVYNVSVKVGQGHWLRGDSALGPPV